VRYNRQTLVTAILILLIATAAVIGIFTFLNRENGSFRLSIAPDEAVMRYNDTKKDVVYGQVISLKEGSYDISFERAGFKTVKQTVSIKRGEQTNVYVYLEPLNDAAAAVMATGNNQLYKEEVIGHDLKVGGEKLTEANPILKVLPILQRSYTVEACSIPDGYKGPGDDKEIAVCISALSDEAYSRALEDIKKRGYDPAQYLVKRVTN